MCGFKRTAALKLHICISPSCGAETRRKSKTRNSNFFEKTKFESTKLRRNSFKKVAALFSPTIFFWTSCGQRHLQSSDTLQNERFFSELQFFRIFAKRRLRRPCFCIFSPSCEVVPRYTMCDKVHLDYYQNPQLGRRHVLCSSCRISSTTRVATTLRRNYVAAQFLVALQLGKKWKNGKIPNFKNSFGFGRHPVARGSSELPFAAAHPCPHTPRRECWPNAAHSIFI